jgi:hypothetical protein
MLSTSADQLAINVITYSGFRILQRTFATSVSPNIQAYCKTVQSLVVKSRMCSHNFGTSRTEHAIKGIDPAATSPTGAPSGGLIRQTTVRAAQTRLATTLLGTRDERLGTFSWAFFEPDRDLTPFAFRIHNSQCDFVRNCLNIM